MNSPIFKKCGIMFGILVLVVSAMHFQGCSAPVLAGVSLGGAGAIGGIAMWISKQPWAAKICYFAGDEAALKVMPAANATIDNAAIDFCAGSIAYLQEANGLTAQQINDYMVQHLSNSNLPQSQIQSVEDAAAVLNEFLPAAASTAVLTSDERNLIIAFLQGFEDGTSTCLNNIAQPAKIAKALAKASVNKAEQRAKHPQAKRAFDGGTGGGWFVIPPAPNAK